MPDSQAIPASRSLPVADHTPRLWWLYKPVPAIGLGIFRICFALCLCATVAHLLYFNHLLFDTLPYVQSAGWPVQPVLVVWLVACVMMVFGLGFRIAAIVNYLCIVTIIGPLFPFDYHGDLITTFYSLVLVFAPANRTLALDPLRAKLRMSHPMRPHHPVRTASRLWYFLILVCGLGLVYLDSVFFKVASPHWLHGLGLWLPASLVPYSWVDLTSFLNIKPLVFALGYLTLFYEMFFLLFIWSRRTRPVIAFIGIGLHLGISLTFPIPLFGFIASSALLLLIPFAWWRAAGRALQAEQPSLTVYYDEDCGICYKTRLVIEHLDARNTILFRGAQSDAHREPALQDVDADRILHDLHAVDSRGRVFAGVATYRKMFRRIPLLWGMLVLATLPPTRWIANIVYRYVADHRLKNNCTIPMPVDPSSASRPLRDRSRMLALRYRTPIVVASIGVLLACQASATTFIAGKALFGSNPGGESVYNQARRVQKQTVRLFGIGNHPIFVQAHFTGYDHTGALVLVHSDGRREWLPIVRPDGRPGWAGTGRLWKRWAFGTIAAANTPERLNDGLRIFTAYWAHERGQGVKNATFVLMVKPYGAPHGWTHNEGRREERVPWQQAGVIRWRNGVYSSQLDDIEAIPIDASAAHS